MTPTPDTAPDAPAGEKEGDCPQCRRYAARVRRVILGDCPDCVLALFDEPDPCPAHRPIRRQSAVRAAPNHR